MDIIAQFSNQDNSLQDIINSVSQIILGKERQIKLVLACFLAGGHCLIEDRPGMGKTTLAKSFAKVLNLNLRRVQFTSDLLPADILGVSIYSKDLEKFQFQAGPMFTQILLADEINRATPKTQSALLEAMEEFQVSIDGTTYPLPKPFFVIATQNPSDQIGTYSLPESELDRFLMRLHLEYIDSASERILLKEGGRQQKISSLTQMVTEKNILAIKHEVDKVHVSDNVLDYLQALLACSRNSNLFDHGLSPRAAIGLLQAAKSWALIEQRDYILPEDIQAVLPAVVNHRLLLSNEKGVQPADLIVSHVAL